MQAKALPRPPVCATPSEKRGGTAPRVSKGISFFDALRHAPARRPSLAWLALVIGFAASFGVLLWVNGVVERKAQAAFAEDASDTASEVARRARAYADVLFAVRGLFDVSQNGKPA